MEIPSEPKAATAAKRGRPKKIGPLKSATSFRLSAQERRLLEALADDTGISQTSVVEQSLRDMAKRRGVKVEATST